MRRFPRILSTLILVLAPALGRAAAMPDVAACTAAIAEVEHSERLPPKVLDAIGLVESGRLNRRTGVVAPWPWTINVAGVGRTFENAADAIAAVQAEQAAGVRSIDVGCMQVNLFHHPHAFANLEAAFEPASNVHYAASFLSLLRNRTGDWLSAVAAYHSGTGPIGIAYAQRVAAVWPLAVQYGLSFPAGPAPLLPTASDETVDPSGVLTSEFRAKLAELSTFRRERDEALGFTPKHVGAAVKGRLPRAEIRAPEAVRTAARPAKAVASAHVSLVSMSSVDPRNILTPEFRALCLAEAESRRKRDLAYGSTGQATTSPARPH